MATYIQRKDLQTGELETVDECDSYKEARTLLTEYRISDTAAHYYTSQRACKDWHE